MSLLIGWLFVIFLQTKMNGKLFPSILLEMLVNKPDKTVAGAANIAYE